MVLVGVTRWNVNSSSNERIGEARTLAVYKNWPIPWLLSSTSKLSAFGLVWNSSETCQHRRVFLGMVINEIHLISVWTIRIGKSPENCVGFSNPAIVSMTGCLLNFVELCKD